MTETTISSEQTQAPTPEPPVTVTVENLDDTLPPLPQPTVPQITPQAFAVFQDKLNALADSVAIIDRDMADDRKDIDQLRTSMGTIISQLGTMIDEYGRLSKKMQDAVWMAVNLKIKPMERSIQAVQETLDRFLLSKKQVIYFEPKKTSLWLKFKNLLGMN
jgi:ABC-type transporter Mla subunit MlaD